MSHHAFGLGHENVSESYWLLGSGQWFSAFDVLVLARLISALDDSSGGKRLQCGRYLMKAVGPTEAAAFSAN